MATYTDFNPNDQLYRSIEEEMQKTIADQKISHYEILKMSSIKNPALDIYFNAKKDRMQKECSNLKILDAFHGSPDCTEIASEGFRFSRSFKRDRYMFGNGIYLTPVSAKANLCAFGREMHCRTHTNADCTICVRQMLVCHCLMGRQYHPSGPLSWIPRNFDSVVAIPDDNWQLKRYLKYPEYCLRFNDQVQPYILVEYRIQLQELVPFWHLEVDSDEWWF